MTTFAEKMEIMRNSNKTLIENVFKNMLDEREFYADNLNLTKGQKNYLNLYIIQGIKEGFPKLSRERFIFSEIQNKLEKLVFNRV